MNGRVIGLFLVLLLLGLGAGYAVASSTAEEPGRVAGPEPVAAVSPAVPTPTAEEITPDPDTAPLPVNLPMVRERLQNRKDEPGLKVDRPEGWRLASRSAGDQQWNWAVPDNPLNTYKLRIEILKGSHYSVSGAKGAREAALRSTLKDGNLRTLTVESDVANTIVFSYIDSNGYFRVEMDRFVVLDDTEDAYAVVAVTGREVDRRGIEDLVARTAQSMVAIEPKTPDEE